MVERGQWRTALPALIAALALGSLLNPARADAQQLLGRPSPPQPQQQQGLDYFAGTWTFAWTGRESPLTAGPRAGAAAFARSAAGDSLNMTVDGTIDGGAAYKETAVLSWSADRRILTIREHLASGADIQGTGDWSSPIAIQFLSEPVSLKGQTLRLRRTYSVISGVSFLVTEEFSTNGGPFVRLGTGTFSKKP